MEPEGTHFAVWAPNAAQVSVIGDFNGWDPRANPMQANEAGIWTSWCQARQGSLYKYHVVSRHGNHRADKCDPYAFRAEPPPKTGSMVWKLDYEWNDAEWMKNRRAPTRSRRRGRSTSCISGPGAPENPRRRSAAVSSQNRWPTM